jgi:uncharacterized damage-inducible protein DinB
VAIPLGVFFEHSAWANERVLEVCEGLSDEQLDDRGGASYGSIRETLLHILSSEQSYVRRAGGTAPSEVVRLGEFPGFEVLKRAARANGAALAETAAAVPGDRVVTEEGAGFKEEVLTPVYFVQAIHHSGEHRTQIVAMLNALGVAPPEFDEAISGWGWGEATGLMKAV